MLVDVLVLDVASFGSRGYKISETLRVRLDGVPTILLLKKGHASAGSVADAFMTPPFTSRKLLYRVRKVAEKLISRELRAGSLVFDPDTRTVRKGNTAVPLRPKEAALLAMFMHNAGRVLSRQELATPSRMTYFNPFSTSGHVHEIFQKFQSS